MVQEAVDNDTNGWIELDVSGLQSKDGTDIPFRLIANRFKSSSPESESFIHDPLRALIWAQETERSLEGFGLTADWKVTTQVVNHHRTLSATHLYALATVDSDEETVGVTLVKLGS